MTDAARRLDASDAGHAHVHDDDIGEQIGCPFDRLEAVRCLTDDLQVGFLGEHELEAAAEHGVVVDDQHTNRAVVSGGEAQRTQPDTSMRPNAPSFRR